MTPEELMAELLRQQREARMREEENAEETIRDAYIGSEPHIRKVGSIKIIRYSDLLNSKMFVNESDVTTDETRGLTIVNECQYIIVDDFGVPIQRFVGQCDVCDRYMDYASYVSPCTWGTCSKRKLCLKCAKFWSHPFLTPKGRRKKKIYCKAHYRRARVISPVISIGNFLKNYLFPIEEVEEHGCGCMVAEELNRCQACEDRRGEEPETTQS